MSFEDATYKEIIARFFVVIAGIIVIIYGALTMGAWQHTYGEDNLVGMFGMFVSMAITFFGGMGLMFLGGINSDIFNKLNKKLGGNYREN